MSADKITPSETPRTLPEYVKCITDDGQELPMRRCPACKKPSFIGYRCDGCDLAAEREREDRLIAFLADDALAITYQSLAQYRQAAIDAARKVTT